MTATASEAAKEASSPSSNGEGTVREKLDKTTIEANELSKEEANATENVTTVPNTAGTNGTTSEIPAYTPPETRGRSRRKRSHDESEYTQAVERARKRSRDAAQVDDADDEESLKAVSNGMSKDAADTNGTKDDGEAVTTEAISKTETASEPASESSPQTKRTKVDEPPAAEVEVGDTNIEGTTSKQATKSAAAAGKDDDNAAGITNEKKEADSLRSVVEEPAASTSSTATAPNAFASSGFGAFAQSSTSAFGAPKEGQKLSSFASTPATTTSPATASEVAKPSVSSFGGALGSKPAFSNGTTPSGFGSGSGFGGGFSSGGFGSAARTSSGFGSGAKLSSFASKPGATTTAPKKPVKPFGAPADAESEGSDAGDDADEDGAQVKSPSNEDSKRDERFFEQDLKSGEEGETTEYTCRAKLYSFVASNPEDEKSKKEWKERGLGTLRLKLQTPDGSDAESSHDLKARLVMRAEGSHRVILNTPVKKEIKFGSVSGDMPVGGYMYFMGSIDDKPKLELLQLKMRQQFAIELHEHILGLQSGM